MCGIGFCSGFECKDFYECMDNIKSRGPESTQIMIDRTNDVYMGFNRLTISGGDNAMQPFKLKQSYLICNGQIYSYGICEISPDEADCTYILNAYVNNNLSLDKIDGEYAFVIYDKEKDIVTVGRDDFGKRPLYIAIHNNQLAIFSEIKGFPKHMRPYVKQFPPATITKYSRQGNIITSYYTSPFAFQLLGQTPKIGRIRNKLISSILLRATINKDVGYFLSGGLDSAIILSVICKYYPNITHYAFTCGTDKSSTDIRDSRKIVDALRTKYNANIVHKVLIFDPQEIIDNLPQIINSLETFDTTTIRATAPQWMLSKWIAENTNIKVMLSGEGADELFGGYLYFHYAPNNIAADLESRKLLSEINYYDGQRVDRAVSSHGLQVHLPYLTRDFVKYVTKYSNRFSFKNRIEKHYLRAAFSGIIPRFILNKQKEALSDGVGYNWFAYLRKYCSEQKYKKVNSHITPHFSEEKFFQKIFRQCYPDVNTSEIVPRIWLPNSDWINTNGESSAAASLSIHNNAETVQI